MRFGILGDAKIARQMLVPAMRNAGAEIVFVQVEDEARESCSSDEAQRHISRKIGNEVGYRVGDEDSRPGNGNYFTNAGLVESYPTVAIVRRRDMRVIADNSTGAALLDLVEVARDPERDWTVPYVPEVVDRPGVIAQLVCGSRLFKQQRAVGVFGAFGALIGYGGKSPGPQIGTRGVWYLQHFRRHLSCFISFAVHLLDVSKWWHKVCGINNTFGVTCHLALVFATHFGRGAK